MFPLKILIDMPKKPISPAVSHLKEFIENEGLKITDVASSLAISKAYLSNVLNGWQPLTKELCCRLESWSGMRASFWWQLDSEFHLELYKEQFLTDHKNDSIQPLSVA